MKYTKEEYSKLAEKKAPRSKGARDITVAFFVGGGVCTLGQIAFKLFTHFGVEKELAFPLSSVVLVLISAILTGIGIYDDIAKHAGAGTLVPITGFANSVVSPAIEFKSEGWILGLGAKMFIIAGPVIVYGVVASVVYGVIYWITKMI